MFKLEDYKGKYAMWCKTEEEANEFLDILYKDGRTWSSGRSYKELNRWEEYNDETCYGFNEGRYLDREFYEEEGYEVLEWSKVSGFSKRNLKTGMVVEYRKGDRRIVFKEKNELVSFGDKLINFGYNSLIEYRDDLTYEGNRSLDIVKVYKIKNRWELFNSNIEKYEVVWQKKTRMTIEEVRKRLGIENLEII